MGGEETLFEHRDARVTTSSVYVRRSNSTYFLSQITSLRVTKKRSLLVTLGFALFVVSLPVLLSAWNNSSLGLALFGVAFVSAGVSLMTARPWYTLMITTSAGQIRALTSKDFDLIHGVEQAILQGMARR